MSILNNSKCFWLITVLLVACLLCLGLLSALVIYKSTSLVAAPITVAGTAATTAEPLSPWIQKFQNDAQKIVQALVNGPEAGKGYNWLAYIADTFGSRAENSKALNNTINYIVNYTSIQGFDNVRAEPVTVFRNWVRGEETATLISPRMKKLSILGIGNSIPTTVQGITAEAIVFSTFDEMYAAGNSSVQGKIVVFNEAFNGSYGRTIGYRTHGAREAAKYGAVAVLVRSVTSFSVYSPHTGTGATASIPQACLTVEDAMMLGRMQQRGVQLRIHLKMTSHTVFNSSVQSANTIFELQGSTQPEKIVLISGHLDSWDVGQGAMDDGGGCAVMWQAMTTLLNLGLRPKRTIRAIFFTAEENGFNGARQYYQQHKSERHVFAAESDVGAFRPTSLNATIRYKGGPSSAASNMHQINLLLSQFGIPLSLSPTDEVSEVEYWASNENVTGIEYLNWDTYNKYFTFHHTQGDTMTVLKPDDLDYVSALFAVYAHVIANMDEDLS